MQPSPSTSRHSPSTSLTSPLPLVTPPLPLVTPPLPLVTPPLPLAPSGCVRSQQLTQPLSQFSNGLLYCTSYTVHCAVVPLYICTDCSAGCPSNKRIKSLHKPSSVVSLKISNSRYNISLYPRYRVNQLHSCISLDFLISSLCREYSPALISPCPSQFLCLLFPLSLLVGAILQ